MGRMILMGVVVLSAFIGGICFMAQRALSDDGVGDGVSYRYGFSQRALEGWTTTGAPLDILSISIGDKGCVVVMQRVLNEIEEQRLDALLINVGCQKVSQ